MPTPLHRPFDAMLFIAATAVGCAVLAAIWSARGETAPLRDSVEGVLASFRDPTGTIIQGVGNLGWLAAATCAPLLACWSLALAVVILSSPRPVRRRLATYPGPAACVLIGPVVGMVLVFAAVSPLYGGIFYLAEECSDIVTYASSLMVCAYWMAMALLGRWRLAPTWIDRLGRLLGLAWVLIAPLIVCRYRLGAGVW
jgi:hypothetical protein